MHTHGPIARYTHICTVLKKFFVRGVVRGIHFCISLLQRLSPEGGQNWHKWPSPMCYYMHKSHLYTTLTHQSGRKQRLLPIAPPVLSDISSSGSTALLRTTGSSFLPVKRQDWQNSLFSPSGTFLQKWMRYLDSSSQKTTQKMMYVRILNQYVKEMKLGFV